MRADAQPLLLCRCAWYAHSNIQVPTKAQGLHFTAATTIYPMAHAYVEVPSKRICRWALYRYVHLQTPSRSANLHSHACNLQFHIQVQSRRQSIPSCRLLKLSPPAV